MEGMWIQKLNADGKIHDLTVMLRPYSAVTVLRNAVKKTTGTESAVDDRAPFRSLNRDTAQESAV
jgi:hypothetical protein